MEEFLRDLAAGVTVFLLGWVINTTRASARTAAKLVSHEKTCADRYSLIDISLHEIKKHLSCQDEKSEVHRDSVACTLDMMKEDIITLKENKRMRERAEDQDNGNRKRG